MDEMDERIKQLLAKVERLLAKVEARRARPSPHIIQLDDFGLARIEANFDADWAQRAGYTIYPSYEDAELAASWQYRYILRSVQQFPSQFAGRTERFPSVVWTNDASLAAAHQKAI